LKGFSAFEVLTISRLQFEFIESQVQPDQKFFKAISVNFNLKSSKVQKFFFIISDIVHFGKL